MKIGGCSSSVDSPGAPPPMYITVSALNSDEEKSTEEDPAEVPPDYRPHAEPLELPLDPFSLTF